VLSQRAYSNADEVAYAFLRDDLTVAEQLTYRELLLKARAVANEIALHATPGDRVLLAFSGNTQAVIGFWACMLAGVAAVPTPPLDAVRMRAALPRLRGILDDAKPSLVLTTKPVCDVAASLDLGLPAQQARWLAADTTMAAPDSELSASVGVSVAASSITYLQYTSGSTSAPRGVALSHANVLANCHALIQATSSDRPQRVLSWLPYFHDYGLVMGLIAPVVGGVPTYLMTPVQFIRRPLRWLEAVDRYGITVTGGPNFAFATCCDSLERSSGWRANLTSLTNVTCGAEPINPTTLQRFIQAFAQFGLAPTAVAPAYGLAEATLGVTMKAPQSAATVLSVSREKLARGVIEKNATASEALEIVSCGEPLYGTIIRIVAPETREVLNENRVGEVWVHSASVGREYHEKPTATEATFRARLGGDNRDYLRTGDLGFVHRGELFVTGRLKDLLIIRGRNFYPQDIEWTAERAHAGVRAGHCAAFSVPTAKGEELVLLVGVERNVREDLPAVAAALRSSIAAEHELPLGAIVFVPASNVPRTSSGKIRRQNCRDDYLSGKFDVLFNDAAQLSEEAQSANFTLESLHAIPERTARLARIERELMARAAEHLRVSPSQISLQKSAVENGLDSLSSAALAQHFEECLRLPIDPTQFLAYPTLRDVASALLNLSDGASSSELASVDVLPPHDSLNSESGGPLAPAQRRLWFLALTQGEPSAYHIGAEARIIGTLDVAALRLALHDLVARHEALRTVFTLVDGTPRRSDLAPGSAAVLLAEHDFRGQQDVVETLEQAESSVLRTPFDLTTEIPIRAHVARLADSEYRLLLCIHHLAADGWSMAVIARELGALYEARCSGARPALARAKVTYGHYAQAALRDENDPDYGQSLDFWQRTLRGAPPILRLPHDHPRPSTQDFRGAAVSVEIESSLVQQLERLSAQHGTTLYSLLLTSWAALLARLSGQDDLVIGSPIANRGNPQWRDVVGCFVNTVPVRIDCSGTPTFAELLRRVHAANLAAQRHQRVTFEEIVRAVNPARSAAYSPLFQTLFTWQSVLPQEVALPGAVVASFNTRTSATSQFDLSLTLEPRPSGVVGSIEYAAALFERGSVERIAQYWRALLTDLLASPDQRIDQAALVADVERARLLALSRGSKTALQELQPVRLRIAAQARAAPQAVAIESGSESVTYAELESRVARLAAELAKQGIERDACIGVAMARTPELLVAMLAIWEVGAAFVPLDPAYPRERLRFMLADARPRCVLLDAESPALAIAKELGIATRIVAPKTNGHDRNPAAQVSAPSLDSLAYVIYTSGSTGEPKAAMIEHRSLANYLTWMSNELALAPGSRVLQHTSMSFDASVWELFAPLIAGATVVMVPAEIAQSPGQLATALADKRITHVSFVPSVLKWVLAQLGSASSETLQYVQAGGEPLEPGLAAQIRQQWPQAILGNFYGVTEACDTSVHCRITDADTRAQSMPIGRPLPNTSCYVLDSNRQLAPLGVAGEIYIGGVGVARGYLHRESLTAERFLPNPFVPGERLYRTGDLGRYRVDGVLEHLGRVDRQLKLNGVRIEPGEIEARIAGVEGVTMVSAAVVEKPVRRIVAFYSTIDAAPKPELAATLRATLPNYLLPSALVHVREWPLSPNGKTDHARLGEFLERDVEQVPFSEPRGEREELLAGIWCSLLGQPRVSRDDNFFAIGGHSLLAVMLVEAVRNRGFDLNVQDVLARSTLADLAPCLRPRVVAAEPHDVASPLAAIELHDDERALLAQQVRGGHSNIQDVLPLLPLQQGMLYQHTHAKYDTYVATVVSAFATRDGVLRYVDALNVVTQRHDALRASFHWEGLSQPVQVIERSARIEAIALPQAADDRRELAQVLEEFPHDIDIRRAPLCQAVYAHDARAGRWLLRIASHHLTGDHATLDAMRAEVGMILTASTAALPHPVSLRRAVHEIFARDRSAEYQAFFSDLLHDFDAPNLPWGLDFGAVDARAVESVAGAVRPSTIQAIRALAHSVAATPASVFHVAWAVLLARISASNDVVFGTVMLGRASLSVGGNSVFGLFNNTVPARFRMTDDSIAKAVARMHRLLTQLVGVEQASLAVAQRCSAVPPPAPLLTTLLNYRHDARSRGAIAADPANGTMLSMVERDTFALSLAIDDRVDHFELTVNAAPGIGAARILRLFEQTLAQLVSRSSGEPVAAIEVLEPGEYERLIARGRGRRRAGTDASPIHALIEQQVIRTPDAIAVRTADRSVTYRELNAQANQLARYLRSRGIQAESIAAINCVRSVELVVAMLAVWKAGGAFVALDADAPAERRQFMLEDARPKLLLSDGNDNARRAARELDLPHVDLLARAAAWTSGDTGDLAPGAQTVAKQAAYLIYTSGSTGRPKAAVVEHRSLANHMRWMAREFPLAAGQIVLQKTPTSFDASVWEFWAPLMCGATLALARPDSHRDPERLCADVVRFGAHTLQVVPTLLDMLLATPAFAESRSLRRLFCGGEPLSSAAVARVEALLPDVEVINLYGPTEATIDATFWRLPRNTGTATVPIGVPIENTDVYVLGPDGALLPDGAAGELFIGGAAVARGYWARPDLTAQRFLLDRHSRVPNAIGYRTGDRVRWRADGALEFLGRIDDQIKLRGVRIELSEIEAELARLEGVKLAAAALIAGDSERDPQLVAYVVGQENARLDTNHLRAQLADRLPRAMLPEVVVLLTELPTLPSGKVDRKSLPRPATVRDTNREHVRAHGPIEEALLDIWRAVLPGRAIDIHTNFFDAGGHSLLATQIMSRVRQALQVDLPLATLFDGPTIAELARAIAEATPTAAAVRATPIQRVDRARAIPASFSQRRMWFVQQFEPRSTAYNMSYALRLRGPLDVGALQAAIAALMERHEAFRTWFELDGGEPVQRIAPTAVPVQLVPQEFSELEPTARLRAAEDVVRARANEPFDLALAPLWRVDLLRLDREDHVLAWSMHHAIGDQWSTGILVREIATFYSALRRGQVPVLEPLVIGYADYAAWQRQAMDGAALAAQLHYWRERLRGIEPLALPTDRQRPQRQSFAGGTISAPLATTAIEALQRVATRLEATPFMVLLACFKLVMARRAAQSDIAVGVPIANRNRIETEHLVGTLVNTLVMRTDLAPCQTFADLVRGVRQTALEAYANQDVSFEKLVSEIGGQRDGSTMPLVHVLFNVTNAPLEPVQLDGLAVDLFDVEAAGAQFDLSMSIDTQAYPSIALSYASALFDRSTAAAILDQYRRLLEQVLANPTRSLVDYTLLSDAERSQLVREWNHTARNYGEFLRTDQLIARQASLAPQLIAVSQGAAQLTYAELDARANRLAGALRRRGADRGALIGLCLNRHPDMLVALLAVMKTGAAYVPLDPGFPAERLAFMVEDAGLAMILCERELAGVLPQYAERTVWLEELFEQHDTDIDARRAAMASDDLAYVLYTSGSTGKPKGVEVPHRALTNFLLSMREAPGCRTQDILLAVTTLSFDIAGLELLLPLVSGARVEIASRQEASDARLLAQRLKASRATMMQATPATWRMLFDSGWRGQADLVVLCGGEPLPQPLAQRILSSCQTLWNLYGPTESTIWSTRERIESADQPITIGQPIANTTVHLLDSGLAPVPIGVTGEIYIGGIGVARGYRNRADLTAERFIADPFDATPGARLYRTGDLGKRLADGRVVHLGRVDFQVKIRGFRVELGEIEAALAKHAAIQQCVVSARSEGGGSPRLVGYYIPRTGAEPEATELRQFLRQSLPDYMVPTQFMALTEFPLTANKKIDVKSLPAPEERRKAVDREAAEPMSLIEVQMASLWRQVLQDDSIGTQHSFFESGGDSIRAVQLLALVERVFGRQLPLATLFEAPTVRAMAQLLSDVGWVPTWRSAVLIQSQGDGIPWFFVPGAGGNVLVFSRLAQLLGQKRRFFGLQARGLDGLEVPDARVPVAAANYIREIRSIQPQGPYLIAGTCTGGVFAYEIAQQLRAAGETVSLAIVESWHPSSYVKPRLPTALLWPVRAIGMRLALYAAELRSLPLRRWPNYLRSKLQRAREMFGDSPEATEFGSQLRVERVTRAAFDAVGRYKTRPYGGRILNVVASGRKIDSRVTDTRRVWEGLAHGVHQVAFIEASDSGQLFVSPHVERLASELEVFLEAELRQGRGPAAAEPPH
jgi:amino acid adenylation domain-containing protein